MLVLASGAHAAVLPWPAACAGRRGAASSLTLCCVLPSRQSSDRWLALRVEFLSAVLLAAVSALTVVAVDSGDLDASFAGFALSLSLGIVGMLSFMVRLGRVPRAAAPHAWVSAGASCPVHPAPSRSASLPSSRTP